MRKLQAFLIVAGLLSSPVHAGVLWTNERLEMGELPPPLSISTVFGGPDSSQVNWDSLRGKAVVLEFWATWCGPCVKEIRHLNRLADAMQDEEMVFISITAEEAEVVQRFLKKRRMAGWVALDDDERTKAAFGVVGIPQTFLIDRDGLLRDTMHPSFLTEADLESLLRAETSDTREGGSAASPHPGSTRKSGFSYRFSVHSVGAGEVEFNGEFTVDDRLQVLDGVRTPFEFSCESATVLSGHVRTIDPERWLRVKATIPEYRKKPLAKAKGRSVGFALDAATSTPLRMTAEKAPR